MDLAQDSCKACYDADDASQCGRCFGETHIYAFYLDLVNGARDPPVCTQHAATELCAMVGVNGTATEVGTLAAASVVARQALADADAAAGPGGLILGGIVLGLAVGFCCAKCGKKKADTKGYKPVTFNQE